MRLSSSKSERDAREKVATRESRGFYRSERLRRGRYTDIREILAIDRASRYRVGDIARLSLAPIAALNEYTDNNPYSVSLGWAVLRKSRRPCIMAS